MEDAGYTIVDWLSTGVAVCTVFISFIGYLYFKARLEIKDLKSKNEELINRFSTHDNEFHELTEKYTDLKKEYEKLKEGHTIHDVQVIGAKPVGVSATMPEFRYMQSEEFIADTKMQLAQQIGIYCLQNNYIYFEENYSPIQMTKTLVAYLSVASNNEEIIKVLRPNPGYISRLEDE